MVRDRSYRGSIAEKVNPFSLIKKKIYEERNRKKTWEYRKYTDIDENFICISKDGTLGEVWKVGGLYIGLPSIEGKEVVNADLKPDNAFWKRTEIPQDFRELEENYRSQLADATSQTDVKSIRSGYKKKRLILLDKYAKFIDKEYEKRENGFFIKIDEEVFYMTGSNYMFLNYYYLTDSDMYPLFRTTAVYTWWHWEAVRADDDAFGEIRFKSRRVAWTSEAASEALNYMTITKYGNIPIVSERKELAWELFQSKIVDSFKYYPTYFKPVINDPNDLPKTKIEITHDTPKKETSRIKTYPTKLTAYDSTRVNPFAINDEIFKFEDVDFSQFRSRHKRCYNKSKLTKPKGKFGSTTGDKKLNTSSAQYEWENSDPLNRDKTGKTNTGLIALFVDCCYTWAEEAMFDKWGYPIVGDPKKPIENEIGEIVEFGAVTKWNIEEQNAKNMKKSELNSFYRNVPRTIEHALRDEGGVNNDFEIDNLNDHLDYLNMIPDSEMANLVFTGNLAWKGEPYDSEVEWIPNPKGKFRTSWIPPKEMQNKYEVKAPYWNKASKKIKTPSNPHIGCFGIDSYDMFGQTKDGAGSPLALAAYSKFNMEGAPCHSFFISYVERPKRPEDAYDDVIMAMQFWGMYANIENNKAKILEHIYEKGYTGYVLRRPDKKYKHLSDFEKKYGGQPSSTQVIEDEASLLKTYIFDRVGIGLEEGECVVYLREFVKGWVKYNINKRKEHDLAVASGKAIMGAQFKVKQRKVIEGLQNSGVSFSAFSA